MAGRGSLLRTDAALSHISAAALWDLRRSGSARIHISIPLPAKPRSAQQLTVHRSADPYEIATRNAIPVTTPSRTIQDCAALLSLHDLTRLVEQAEKLHLLDVDQLQPTRGRKGAPTPQVNVLVEGYTVDFLWPRARLIAETDGRRDHGTAQAFQRDRSRDQRLLTLGYRVVRFTYADVTERPASVAATFGALLRS